MGTAVHALKKSGLPGTEEPLTGDDPNPPATTDTYGYGYSNTGSTTSATVQGTPQTFTYDLEGHLDTATVGGQAQSNIYDADGNLLIRTEPGRKTLYLGDTELHVNGGTQLSGTRTYTPRSRQPGEGVGCAVAASPDPDPAAAASPAKRLSAGNS